MITFEELKERTTHEIIKKMVELAEGFEFIDGAFARIKYSVTEKYANGYIDGFAFPLLLYRAVDGWNKKNLCKPIQILCNCISFITDEDEPASIEWGYDNEQYQPCHLTQCEMAILDCLIEVLK